MEIWVATGNKAKLNEFKILLASIPDLKLYSTQDLPIYSAPPETGKTYLDNARIKAKSLSAMKPGHFVFADDSGLEVIGLGGLPGVHSARYAGEKARDSENRNKLLKMLTLKQVANRAAEFKCVLVVITPSGEEWVFEGELKGEIAKKESGLHGFGYDSVFIPVGEKQTLAELPPGYKNQHSHRAVACRKLLHKLQQISL